MNKFGLFIIAFIFLIPGFSFSEPEYELYPVLFGCKFKWSCPIIEVDRDGALWVCSGGWVFRHNSSGWEDFTAQSGGASLISVSPDSLLWFASADSLKKYDGTKWESYPIDESLSDGKLNCISAAPNNVIWLGFTNYSNNYCFIAKFSEGKFTRYQSGLIFTLLSYHSITASKEGGLWIHLSPWGWLDCDPCPKGATYFNGTTFTHYFRKDGLPGDTICWMTYSKDNNDMYGISGGSLIKFSDNKWSILQSGDYWGIVKNDADGNLWHGYFGGYFHSYLNCNKGGKWVEFNLSELADSLSGKIDFPFCQSLAVTPDGMVWMGLNNGILKINPKSLPIKGDTKVESENPVPANDSLSCYPNPFNSSATIKYYLDKDSPVSVEIYNSIGQKIRTVTCRNEKSGFNFSKWDGTNYKGERVATGFYTVVVRLPGKLMTRKLLFLK